MEEKNRILIVEDDEDISMVEEAYLKLAGFETEGSRWNKGGRCHGEGVL